MALSVDGKIKLNNSFFAEKSVIISKSGYGKSYTARVIIEEGLETGNTFVVIDPQEAYLNLKGFDYINAEDIKSVTGFGALIALSNKNVVISTKRLSIEQQNAFLQLFLSEYRKRLQKGIHTIVIDETHKFAPEGKAELAKDIVRGMFQENRSDGLGCIAITQRISRLDKTILSQADNLLIGRVTSFRDKEAVKNYIDNPDDLEIICKLEKGEFFINGLGLEQAVKANIRKAKTKHSGESPNNLLTEDASLYSKNKLKFVRKSEKNMENPIKQVEKVLPSGETFLNLAKMGAKISLGTAIGGVVGKMASAIKSPLPIISSRTLGSGASTIALYAGNKVLPIGKDIMKYATAGSAVYTIGSLAFDVLNAFNVQLPSLLNFTLETATGVTNSSMDNKAESGKEVDLNTKMA